MQFEFKNLGTIKEAQLEMGKLTVICGKNNTGKTYLTYGVWGILAGKITDNIIKEVYKNKLIPNFLNIDKIQESFYKNGRFSAKIDNSFLNKERLLIYKIYEALVKNAFSFSDNFLINLSVDIDFKYEEIKINTGDFVANVYFNNEKLIEIDLVRDPNSDLFKNLKAKEFEGYSLVESAPVSSCESLLKSYLLFPERESLPFTFILPAQRDSIELFYKELDKNRSHLLEKIRETRDLRLLDKESSRFPQPIEKLIDFARDLTRQVIKTESFLAKEQPELLKEVENLLGVTYEVSGDEVLIKDKNSTQKIPAYMASTSVRSLMHLHFWLKHKAQKGDLLMIDEPELNLHPENQIKMARLFAKLVNAGIKVWITTHSDYIIKELNNCLMFSQDIENKKELLEELGYKENEILKKDDIRAYIARYDKKLEGCTVDKVEFDEYGMVMTTFDEQARNINRIAHRLADEIDEKQLKQTSLEND